MHFWPDTPILCFIGEPARVTANAFDEDRQAAMAAGMNAHIAKPFLPETLYQTIHAWLSE